MPAHHRHQALQTPASPVLKSPTAKYTNKDGTKSITIPKSSASTPPAQPSPTATSSSSKGGAPTNPDTHVASTSDAPAPNVNRKKQKRRAKAAAKAAAAAEAEEEDLVVSTASNGLPSPPASAVSAPILQAPTATPRKTTHAHHHHSHHHHHHHVPLNHPEASGHHGEYWDDETESDDDHHLHSYHGQQTNGSSSAQSKKSKKKKKQKGPTGAAASAFASELEHRAAGISKEKIWNTSSQEERERIKQFWLGLGEDERKSLVKVEKDAVLKKMKEQQKHTCSCSVCGRKRTAIEEELEGLYDAYYEELESFANHPHNHPHGPPMLGNPRRLGQMTGLHPPRALPSNYSHHHPSRGRIVEHVDNDDDDDDEDEDEDEDDEDDDVDDDEYSDEEDLDEDDDGEPEDMPQDSTLDFFNFGQSLTVQGGILTVADDLLKNDGKKFIEMMEQLAERRMAREEDAKDHFVSGSYGHSLNGASMPNSHNHPPPDDDEYDEEDEEEEEYDSQEEEYDEEEDTMTEEQRMEEGRRMFQIFAARMFEQRVLTAYKEKVAKERQQKLLEELEDESRQESQKKAKKQREAQKRKDKAAHKKQALAEEKARKDAEKATEEAERLAEEKRRAEEAKTKAEEKRKRKELQRKLEEDERLKKEAERQRRVHEAKERQAEQERKAREAKEREKRLKEEQRVKEKDARELKERETRERREKHEKDKRDKEQRAAQAKAERDAKEKQKQEEKAAQKAAALIAPIPIPTQPRKQQHLASIPALPQQPPNHQASPQIAVATPALPKAPPPMKPRSVSQEVTRSFSQASHSASGASQNASPHPLTPVHSSPAPIGPLSKTSSTGPPNAGFGPHGVPTSPLHAGTKNPPGLGPGPFPMGMPPMGMQYPPGMPMGPGFNQMHNPPFPPMGGNFQPPPRGMPLPPPGLGGPMGRGGFPIPHAPPGFQVGIDSMPGMNPGFPVPEGMVPAQPSSHSRQASASFESSPMDPKHSGASAQPIARPAPIGRPASVVHGHRHHLNLGADEVNDHLGSSALLDDSDETLGDIDHQQRRNTTAPGTRPPYTAAPFMDPVFGSPLSHGWGPQPNIFSPPPGFGNSAWPSNPTFGGPPPGMNRPAQPRSVAVRLMLCRACKDLENNAADANGYIDISAVKGHVDSINITDPVSEAELLDMCETEGNPVNGGGSFDIRHDEALNKTSIRYDATSGTPSFVARNVGAPGEIGSPIVGSIGSFGTRGS
ncbi:hypothetical protein BJ170DRAFT_596718 [Xylariales sp. AK1849]|nr:hypothetical protein BJ170DRAFT_596718 [Xylariales sp. AK1849]